MQPDQAEAIRRRPGMYIGDLSRSGLLHMLWEVVANSVDEHLAGYCSHISVEIAADGSIQVEDDGRGMPLYLVDGVSFAERVLTSIHTTPTRDGHAPHTHVGLHGVGVFPVCALSRWLELQVFQNGRRYWQRFERGKAVSACEERGPADRTGTTLTFAPDPEVLHTVCVDPVPVLARLRELSYLLPKLTFSFRDRRGYVFHEPRGLEAKVQARLGGRSSLPLFAASGTEAEIAVEVAAGWGYVHQSSIESYANVERTTEGGTHVQGMLRGLAIGLQNAAPDACKGRVRPKITEALSMGLVAVVCVRLHDPSFAGPTKDRLETPEAERSVERCVAAAFQVFLAQQPTVLEHLARRLELSR